MKKLTTFLIFLFLFLIPVLCWGQDSTDYKMYIADRDRFIEQQETVKSKNMYLQLQGAITLLNMYIANEERKFQLNIVK